MLLYYIQGSPFARMARVLLREFEIPCAERLLEEFPPAPAYFDVNPLGQVPAIADGAERDFPTSVVAGKAGFGRPGSSEPGFASIIGGGEPPSPAPIAGMAGPGFIRSMAMRSPCVMVGPSRRGAATAGSMRRFIPAGFPSGWPIGTAASRRRGGRVVIASGGLFLGAAGSSSVMVVAGRRGERGALASIDLFMTRGSPEAIVGFRGR